MRSCSWPSDGAAGETAIASLLSVYGDAPASKPGDRAR